MSRQRPALRPETPPAPAWSRTVKERRLLWLVSRHPKMDSSKRYDWAVSAFQPERDRTKS